MGILFDWNDPQTPVRTQVGALLSQSLRQWRELIGYLWFLLRCRLDPAYENWINVQEWERWND